MKLAIFLTGFIRRAHKCTEYLYNQLYKEHDCDVYVSTWNIKSHWRPHPGCEDPEQHPDRKIPVDENYLRNLYGDNLKGFTIMDFDHYLQTRTAFVKLDRPEDVFHTNERAMKHFPYWPDRLMDQWYVVRQAYNLVTEDQYNSYDIILKNRADVKIHNRLNIESALSEAGSKTLHVSSVHLEMGGDGVPHCIDDKIAWGVPSLMKKHFLMYDNIQKMYELKNIDVSHAEHMMAYYLFKWPEPFILHGATIHDISYVTPTED